MLPERSVPRPALLELHSGEPRLCGEVRIHFVAGCRLRVEPLEVGNRDGRFVGKGAGSSSIEVRQLGPLLLEQGDDLPHGSAPVPQVHVANCVGSCVAQGSLHGLTDDRRTQMADVQRLGHVGTAVVDDDTPAFERLGDTEVRSVSHLPHRDRQVVCRDVDVDEARARHRHGGNDSGGIDGGDDGFGELSRVAACGLCCAECPVALKRGELGPRRHDDITEPCVEPERSERIAEDR